jgi:ParB family transcriptional regulator, chromosome partitioning protein
VAPRTGASPITDERSRLGRGLAALMEAGAEPVTPARAGRGQRRVPIEFLKPNPRNPRQNFSEGELGELAQSIQERGIIQPIVVRPTGEAGEAYEIVAGERRWRAAQRAGLHDIPVVVLEVSDAEALELTIIENVQRTDLNALEEAAGYQALATEFSHSQDAIANIVGKSRSHVANTVRLLKLPDAVKDYINAGKLSAGHARALIGQADPEGMARAIVEKGLNVRQAEALAQEHAPAGGKRRKARSHAERDANTVALEKLLSDVLGLVVDIDHQGGGGGTLRIRYRTLEQLDDIIRRLEKPRPT